MADLKIWLNHHGFSQIFAYNVSFNKGYLHWHDDMRLAAYRPRNLIDNIRLFLPPLCFWPLCCSGLFAAGFLEHLVYDLQHFPVVQLIVEMNPVALL